MKKHACMKNQTTKEHLNYNYITNQQINGGPRFWFSGFREKLDSHDRHRTPSSPRNSDQLRDPQSCFLRSSYRIKTRSTHRRFWGVSYGTLAPVPTNFVECQ